MYKIIIHVLLHCLFSYKQAKCEESSKLKLEREDRMGIATFCKNYSINEELDSFLTRFLMEQVEGYILKLNIFVVSTICIQVLLSQNVGLS